MTAAEDMARLGDALAAEIGRIRDELRAGATVETQRLAALVEEIQTLSSRLDAADAVIARPRLLGLLADLDGVQAEMTSAHAALQAELEGASARHRAVSAYNQPRKG